MKFQTNTLSQQIADYIASQIASGQLKPGERLIEENLKEEFGTSRAPIREAMLLLENRGVIERIARRGVFVKEYSKKEILDFYKVVYDLTRYAINECNEEKAHEIIKTVKTVLKDLKKAVDKEDLKECFDLIEVIHQQIFELPNNSTLVDIYLRLNLQWTTFRYLTLSHPDSLRRSWMEYKEIFEAIERKDYKEAIDMVDIKEKRALNIIKKFSSDDMF